MGIYFRSIKALSVGVMGSNERKLFFRDKSTLIEDEGDIYIFRRKNNVIYECDENGSPIIAGQLQPGVGVPGQPGAPTPLSRSVYQGYDAGKKRQIEYENAKRREEDEIAKAKSESESEDNKSKKKSIEDELSEEDDLSVLDEDFRFEGDEEDEKEPKKQEPTKKKPKKSKPKDMKAKKKSTKSKTTKTKKKETTKKKASKKKKKKKDDDDDNFKERSNILKGFSK